MHEPEETRPAGRAFADCWIGQAGTLFKTGRRCRERMVKTNNATSKESRPVGWKQQKEEWVYWRFSMWTKLGKTGEVRSGMMGRHSCTVNGPEWGDCEIEDSDDNMEMSQETVRSKGKRGGEFDGINAKKARRSNVSSGRQEKRA